MAEITYLVSALLMGLFLVVTAIAIARIRDWQYLQTADESAPDDRFEAAAESLGGMARDPAAWTTAFILLAAGIGAGAILYVGGGPEMPSATRQAAGVVIVAALLGTVGLFMFVGTYFTARSKGRPKAQGIAEGFVTLGLLLIGAIVATLVVG